MPAKYVALLLIGTLVSSNSNAQDQGAQRAQTPREQALRDCHNTVKAQASTKAMDSRQRMTAMTYCMQSKREVAAGAAEQRFSRRPR